MPLRDTDSPPNQPTLNVSGDAHVHHHSATAHDFDAIKRLNDADPELARQILEDKKSEAVREKVFKLWEKVIENTFELIKTVLKVALAIALLVAIFFFAIGSLGGGEKNLYNIEAIVAAAIFIGGVGGVAYMMKR
ncbi:MAG: hypothetical protein GDA53_06340 [Rhodobacteraceae bacterium]|nr:hypothetical protein [Paracoccaceae bacterium]